MKIDTLAIMGVGLVGGSVALAARQRDLARRIVGFDPDEKTQARCLALGVVDEFAPAPGSSRIAAADLVICCAPVDRISGLLLGVAERVRSGMLLSDVGSTKATIVREMEAGLPPEISFIGGHPLAGSEKQGPEHASARLFEGRLMVLTPTPRTSSQALAHLSAFWHALGARVHLISPEEHDRAVALTSHLPHLLASALAGLLPPELTSLTASGFRDTTRIAEGDPALWSAIFEQNSANVLAALARLEERLEAFRRALEAGDRQGVQALLAEGERGGGVYRAEACEPPLALAGSVLGHLAEQ